MCSIRLLTTIVMLAVLNSVAQGRILDVPEDYETIQAGIDAAGEGDTVLVAPGVYRGNLDFADKPIAVGSYYMVTGDPAYSDSTIIDGTDNGALIRSGVVRIIDNENARLSGFTIQGGDARNRGGGILSQNSSAMIDYCKLLGNKAYEGGGIACLGGRLNLSHLLIAENSAEHGGGLFIHSQASVVCQDSRITSNQGKGRDWN